MPVGLGVFILTSGVPVLSKPGADGRDIAPGRFTAVPRKSGCGLIASRTKCGR